MCGIILGRRNNGHPVQKALKKRFEKQKGRGTRGFGYIPIENGRVTRIERAETEGEIMAKLKKEGAFEILFHHRTPTSTPNWKETTHPIVVKNPILEHDYYVIHNGVMRNEDDLKKEHEKLGFVYTTEYEKVSTLKFGKSHREVETTETGFNDSEAFAIDLAMYLDGISGRLDSIGSIAFIALKCDKEGNVMSVSYGHNSANPLKIEDTTKNKEGLLFIKSEGNGIDIPEDIIYTVDYRTGGVTEVKTPVGKTYFSNTGYGANGRSSSPSFPSTPTTPVSQTGRLLDAGRIGTDVVRSEEFNTGIKSWLRNIGGRIVEVQIPQGRKLDWPEDETREPVIQYGDPSEDGIEPDERMAIERYNELSKKLKTVNDDIELAETESNSKNNDQLVQEMYAEELRKSKALKVEIESEMEEIMQDYYHHIESV